MKTTQVSELNDTMLPEYEFNYTKAKPNRFAQQTPITVTLDADVAQVFTTSEAVNRVLRSILTALPKTAS